MDNAETERNAIVRLALGRIFRLASRPAQPGDIEQYENARHAILVACDDAPFAVGPDCSSNIALHRGRGAQGQW